MYEITKKTLIGDIMDNAPEVAPLFYSIGMYCLSCDSSRGETLDEACQVHAVDADAFLDQVTAWQQTCQDDPEAAAQAAQAYTMFGMDYGAGDYGSYDGASDLYGLDAWAASSIDAELASFGIGTGFSGFSGFSSEFPADAAPEDDDLAPVTPEP